MCHVVATAPVMTLTGTTLALSRRRTREDRHAAREEEAGISRRHLVRLLRSRQTCLRRSRGGDGDDDAMCVCDRVSDAEERSGEGIAAQLSHYYNINICVLRVQCVCAY